MPKNSSVEGEDATHPGTSGRVHALNRQAVRMEIGRINLFIMEVKLGLVEGDAFDAEAKGAGGDLGLGDFADLLAHQGGADRGFQRNLACFEVHFVWADNLEFQAGVCREVGEFDTAQQTDSVLGEDVGVNHTGMLQDLLQKADTADGLSLHPPRFTVAGIVTAVSLGAGLREVVLHLRINLFDQVSQLGRYFVESFFRQVFHASNLRSKLEKCKINHIFGKHKP